MDNQTLQEFFEELATKYKPIGHKPPLLPKFARVDLDEMAEGLRQSLDVSSFVLLLETPTGKLEDNGGDGYFDKQEIAYWVVRQVEEGDFAGERDTLAEARRHGRILAIRCHQTLPTVEKVDLNTVEYMKVGPVFGKCYGYRYNFTVSDSLEFKEEPELWNE